MKASPSPLPFFAPNFTTLRLPKPYSVAVKPSCTAATVAIPSPPPTFSFKNEILDISTAAIAQTHPQLLDLAQNGTLLLVQKPQYGAVPPWRSEFVEPESIWIIGTTHVSKESAFDVERVIRAVKPENVVVELCRSRAGIMYIPENDDRNQQLRSSMFSLSGTGFFGAVGRSINLGGQTALALRLLLAALSSKVSADINRPFGDEFRAARKAAEEIGAQLVLGDRPIEITLERAWSSLKWKEKLSLVTSVIRGMTLSDASSIKAAEESVNGDSSSSFELYQQLSLSYPSLLPPLIHERDTFMAWSLKRSKAVNGSRNVVGVMGKGHMNGVIYSLVSDTGNLRFRDLAGKRRADSFAVSVAKDLFRDTLIGVVVWLIYQHFASSL